jgi:hypothetical protein
MALIHAGIPIDNVGIKRAFSLLSGKQLKESYDIAIYLMMLEARFLPLSNFEDVKSFSEDEARKLIAKSLTPAERALAMKLVENLLETQAATGIFGYSGASRPNLSNTQYSILGLKSASRMGIRIPIEVWRSTFLAVAKVAAAPGKNVSIKNLSLSGEPLEHSAALRSWGYGPPVEHLATGSMTCAALCILAICRSELERAQVWKQPDQAIYDQLIWGGFGWIQETISMRANQPEACWFLGASLYYYLYGIERAAIFQRLQTIGDHDWFTEGAAILLSIQKPDGRWEGLHGTPVVDTAFALLFLRRTTVPLPLPAAIVPDQDTNQKK